MPKYTVKDTQSGKTITFNWDKPTPPGDSDFEKVIAYSKSPEYVNSTPSMKAAEREANPAKGPSGDLSLDFGRFAGQVRDTLKGATVGAVQGLPDRLRQMAGPYGTGLINPIEGIARTAPGDLANAWHGLGGMANDAYDVATTGDPSAGGRLVGQGLVAYGSGMGSPTTGSIAGDLQAAGSVPGAIGRNIAGAVRNAPKGVPRSLGDLAAGAVGSAVGGAVGHPVYGAEAGVGLKRFAQGFGRYRAGLQAAEAAPEALAPPPGSTGTSPIPTQIPQPNVQFNAPEPGPAPAPSTSTGTNPAPQPMPNVKFGPQAPPEPLPAPPTSTTGAVPREAPPMQAAPPQVTSSAPSPTSSTMPGQVTAPAPSPAPGPTAPTAPEPLPAAPRGKLVHRPLPLKERLALKGSEPYRDVRADITKTLRGIEGKGKGKPVVKPAPQALPHTVVSPEEIAANRFHTDQLLQQLAEYQAKQPRGDFFSQPTTPEPMPVAGSNPMFRPNRMQ